MQKKACAPVLSGLLRFPTRFASLPRAKPAKGEHALQCKHKHAHIYNTAILLYGLSAIRRALLTSRSRSSTQPLGSYYAYMNGRPNVRTSGGNVHPELPISRLAVSQIKVM
jgi:hypothetical protein